VAAEAQIGLAEYSEKRVLPYDRQKLYDIVADVERYPEFLPGWIDARVVRRKDDHALVLQTLGIGPVRTRFRSRAQYRPPEAIDIRSEDGPFQQLEIAWRFESSAARVSEVILAVNVRLKRVVFREYLESWFSTSASSILAAFERRADDLYAHSSPQL
jgi:coenzyme Q-binding protein COQ10